MAAAIMLTACGGGDPESPAAAEVAAVSDTSRPAPANPAQDSGQARALNDTASKADASANELVRIRAAGSLVEGVGARAQAWFNGVLMGSAELSHAESLEYQLLVPGAAAGGTLDIVFTNASADDGRPLRSLRVDSVTLPGAELRPGQPGVVFDAGAGEAAFDHHGLSAAEPTIWRNGAMRFTLPARAVVATTTEPGIYIDAQRGNDANPGTAALPWQTLQRLQPGLVNAPRNIFLRCDSVWRSSLTLAAPQLQAGTVIAGYGPECGTRKATITGADLFVGGWQKSGSVWSRQLPPGTPKITQLFLDGQALRTAQWPNTGPVPSRTLPTAGGTATGASRSLPLRTSEQIELHGRDLAGATVQLRTQSWLIETARVRAAIGGQLELEAPPAWSVAGGRPFLLQDKAWMLDAPGEFFHDIASQRLLFISPPQLAGADANALTVEATVRGNTISLTGRSQLVLRDLAVVAAAEMGLALHNTPQSRVERVEASHNGNAGARLTHWPRESADTPGSTVSDSLFRGNGRFGIDAIEVQRARLLRNRVFGTGMSSHHQGGVIAGVANGPGGHTEDNRVENSGYLGISFSSLGASRVLRNSVDGFCHRLSDCGGIYTWTGRDDGARAGGALVVGNRVLAEPRTTVNPNKLNAQVVVGIYIDDHSHGVTVQDNLLAYVPMGIFVHNASRSNVAGNRIWMPSETGLWASMDDSSGDSMTDNVFAQNLIVPALQAQATAGQLPVFGVAQAVWFWHTQAAETALGSGRNLFMGNTVVQLFGPLASHTWLRGPHGDWHVDTVGWLQLNPAERTPTRPVRFDPLLPMLGSEKIQDPGFDSGPSRWLEHRDPAAWGGITQWLASAAGCTGPCVAFTAASQGDLLASQPFTLKAGAPHLYRWTAQMPAQTAAQVGAPYVSRNGTPWDMMSDGQGYVGFTPRRSNPGETVHYETYFVAKSADAARVNVGLESLRARVLFDSVSVREVLGYSVAPAGEFAALALAPAGQARSVDCQDLGWPQGCAATDLEGRRVNLPLHVEAGGERHLLRHDSLFRR